MKLDLIFLYSGINHLKVDTFDRYIHNIPNLQSKFECPFLSNIEYKILSQIYQEFHKINLHIMFQITME